MSESPVRFLYLHGFGSGPSSQKANWFRRKFHERGAELELPQLVRGAFRETTVSKQLATLEELAPADGRLVVLLGSSMGGYVASLFSALHPGRVARLVLLAPAFGFPGRWKDSWDPKTLTQWRTVGATEVFHHETGQPELIEYEFVTDGELHPDFPRISRPCLIFHGREDETVPLDYSEAFARVNPQARLYPLDSDHSLLNVLDEIWEVGAPFLFPSR